MPPPPLHQLDDSFATATVLRKRSSQFAGPDDVPNYLCADVHKTSWWLYANSWPPSETLVKLNCRLPRRSFAVAAVALAMSTMRGRAPMSDGQLHR
jgi:hypothetical protein